MKIAIIGGSGFIGSHIVDKLIDYGNDVTVFDIVKPHRDVKYVYLDITDSSKTVLALSGGFDIYYLLAAVANVDVVRKNPVEAHLVNNQGVVNVVQAVQKYGGRLIYASTSWVYDMSNEYIADEISTLRLENINHVYTASKLGAELYIQSYSRLYGLEYTILRYGVPYGPRGRAGTVITNFIEKALAHEPIVINGDGSQSRNFIYIEDLARGNLIAYQDIAKNRIYNMDGIRAVSIREIAQIIKEILPSTKIEHTDERPCDFKGKLVSSNKSLKELCWKPTTDIRDGIAKYINWYNEG